MEEFLIKIEKSAQLNTRFRKIQEVQQGDGLETRKFNHPLDNDAQWSLQFYPNGFSAADDGFTSIRMVYHGKAKVTAKFIFEVSRNREEYQSLVDALITKTTTRFNFDPSDVQSIDIPKFISHEVLFNPEYKLFPKNVLFFRVKVLYYYTDEVQNVQNKNGNLFPSHYYADITLVIGKKEIKVPSLPLRLCSKSMERKLKNPGVNSISFAHLDPFFVKLIIYFIYEKEKFFKVFQNYSTHPTLIEYAYRFEMDDLIMLLSNSASHDLSAKDGEGVQMPIDDDASF